MKITTHTFFDEEDQNWKARQLGVLKKGEQLLDLVCLALDLNRKKIETSIKEANSAFEEGEADSELSADPYFFLLDHDIYYSIFIGTESISVRTRLTDYEDHIFMVLNDDHAW